MRVRAEQLFQTSEALRKRVEELERRVEELQLACGAFERALLVSNRDNVSLAKSVRRLENALEAEGRGQVHQEGQEQGR